MATEMRRLGHRVGTVTAKVEIQWPIYAEHGVLVSVMSLGAMTRANAKSDEFRQLVANRGGHFERLGEDSFAESGTSVRTCVVRIHGGAS